MKWNKTKKLLTKAYKRRETGKIQEFWSVQKQDMRKTTITGKNKGNMNKVKMSQNIGRPGRKEQRKKEIEENHEEYIS